MRPRNIAQKTTYITASDMSLERVIQIRLYENSKFLGYGAHVRTIIHIGQPNASGGGISYTHSSLICQM